MMKQTQAKCVFATLVLCAASTLRAEKQYKSPEEFTMYTSVTQAFAANDMPKALAGLDAWKQKFPESDYASNRQQLYVQAYARGGQHARAVERAKPLLGTPFDNADDELRLLYTVVTSAQQIATPGVELQPVAADAARRLMAFDKMPANMKLEDWAKAKLSLQTAAQVTLIHVALTPVREAVKSGECGPAEAAGVKTLLEYPDSVQAAWVLASAQLCLARKDPAKYSGALYSLARAAALDPVKGLVDPAWQKQTAAPYFEKIYTQYRGADAEGLRQLKETAVRSPLPPEGFTLLSAAQIEQQKQAEMESKNPEFALWQRIRAALAAEDGQAYFTASMKDAAVPMLSGVVVGAKPACRPTQLTVAMGPKAGGPAEVLLRLNKPLTGRPELNRRVKFEGVASVLSREPLLLTLESEPGKVTGLKTSPCR